MIRSKAPTLLIIDNWILDVALIDFVSFSYIFRGNSNFGQLFMEKSPQNVKKLPQNSIKKGKNSLKISGNTKPGYPVIEV